MPHLHLLLLTAPAPVPCPNQELWAMLHSASQNDSGVPQQLLEAKQEELRKRREAEAKALVGPA
jgi:hypothetical protein